MRRSEVKRTREEERGKSTDQAIRALCARALGKDTVAV